MRTTPLNSEPVTEHAIRMRSGSYQIRPSETDVPGIEDGYPLSEWIEHNQQFNGKVYRRRIIVVEDWAEVKAS
jgi:hypothetical protein